MYHPTAFPIAPECAIPKNMYSESIGVMKRAESLANSTTTCAILAAGLLLVPALMSAEPKPLQPASNTAACELKIVGESIEKLTLINEVGIERQLYQPGQKASPPTGQYRTGIPVDIETDAIGQTQSLPAGRYRVTQVELTGGYRCTVTGTGEDDAFQLVPGKPCELKVGAPLNPSVKVTRQGRLLMMNYQLLDAGGRTYSNQNRTNPPRFAVFKDDQEIGSGSFEYG